MRVVLDTNVVISALLFRSGPTARIRQLWQAGVLRPLLSAETTKELLRVLCYPKFRLTDEDRDELLHDYLPFTEAVQVDPRANALNRLPVCRDPQDVIFLELAQAGEAELLITGDADLLELDAPYLRRVGFSIVTPAQALLRWPA